MSANQPPIYAVEYVRGFTTSTRPQLLRCSDERDYLVKFKDNRFGPYVVANEWICYRLATHLGLPVPEAGLVTVTKEFIQAKPELAAVTGTNRLPEAGLQFGSVWNPYATPFSDEEEAAKSLKKMSNRDCLAGIVLFDRWVLNADRKPQNLLQTIEGNAVRVWMVDHGHCLGIGKHDEWVSDFSPLERQLRTHFLSALAPSEDYERWSHAITSMDDRVIERIVKDLPDEWGIILQARLYLADYLCKRKTRLMV